MKKQNRLRKNTDFKATLDAKQHYTSKSFVVAYRQNNLNLSRIGITLSSKYGNAVERNKAKRQVRMMVMKLFDFTQPIDCVIIIKSGFKFKSYEENEGDLATLHQKQQKQRGEIN